MNRLADETSPYLLQHAGNPVDWYPWGDAAFERARKEDKPVFLSVGYSACHWCHVMERESFESDEVAAFLNAHFVSVKVDREERPDVDAVYMDAVQALSGRGGWPMSVFLAPDRRPFYGGTYWPHPPKYGQPGFLGVLHRIAHVWEHERDHADTAAEGLTDAVSRAAGAPPSGDGVLEADLLDEAGRSLLRYADREDGGFGRAPKFPHAVDLRVLLRSGGDDGVKHVRKTLDLMARGGIYDQLGGGFHRYSTDGEWLVPHFEKMLYDQALLVPALLEADQASAGASAPRDLDDAARETCEYVLREMTTDGGAFAAAQDADTDGEEGKFFVWDRAELDDVLGTDDAEFAAALFAVTPGGNWEGRTILTREETRDADADRIADVRRRLREHRDATRTRPFRDDKVVASWNGLMIGALGRTAAVLDEPPPYREKLADAALAAADFLRAELWHDGTLHRSWKDGRRGAAGFAEDYFAVADGLCELWQARQEPRLLAFATELCEAGLAKFGGPTPDAPLFQTAADRHELPARRVEATDGATPGGTTLAASALQTLALITGREDFAERAVQLLSGLSGVMKSQPMQAGWALLALARHLGPPTQVVLAGEPDGVKKLRRAFFGTFAPHAVLIDATADCGGVHPGLLAGKEPPAGGAAFVCERGACGLPITDAEALRKRLLPANAGGR